MTEKNLTNPNLDASWEDLRKLATQQAQAIQKLQEQLKLQECRCHIIDPSKMRILLWINRHKNGKPDTCVLKIAEQRLLGLPRSDRRGETYWRFDELLEKVKETPINFKCSECKEEVVVIGSDNYQEEIRQREALKKELAQMESKSETSKAKPQVKPSQEEPQEAELKVKEQNPTRQALKEQIAQAIKENQEQKPNATP